LTKNTYKIPKNRVKKLNKITERTKQISFISEFLFDDSNIEIGTLPDERDAHLLNDVNKHYNSLGTFINIIN